ncbi:MAG: hypothetical protein HYV63_30965 [Candidatus Schekmanbacteria bacterium]|nr:hypothetical protein [Candidatus Schekmanbacteria bacterium]
MRTAHDRLAKQMLRTLLASVGAVRVEEEVAAEVLRIDVWFTPDPGARYSARLRSSRGVAARFIAPQYGC